MSTYLITSGTAKTGTATIKALRSLGVENIIAGTRSVESQQDKLLKVGASKVVHLDYENEDSIRAALKGVDGVFVALGSNDIAQIYARVVRLAEEAQVKTIVGIGAVDLDTSGGAFDEAIKAAEKEFAFYAEAGQALLGSKVPNRVVVSPSWFFDNFLAESYIQQIKQGKVIGAAGKGRTGSLALSDIGLVAAHALLHPERFNGKSLDITGPEAVTDEEIVLGLGKTWGFPVEYVNLSSADYIQALVSVGLPTETAQFYERLEWIKSKNLASKVTTTIKEVTGRDPLSLADWLLTLPKPE